MAGCGGSDDSGSSTSGDTGSSSSGSNGSQAGVETTSNPAPKGASPFLEEIYRQFPPPEPNPEVKGSAKAIETGERVCEDKTPLEIREEFMGEADLLPDQSKMVEELPKFENESSTNTSFVAGQLAALVYEGTLQAAKLKTYGFQGCIYSLAVRLERENAPSKP